MAFKSSSVASPSTTTTSSVKKPVGGRYAGIRPPGPGIEALKAGEYVLELVGSKNSRKGSCAMIQCIVIDSQGDGCTPVKDREVRQFFINYGGDAWDAGSARLVALAMAVCGCSTVEQLADEEPKYDELIDTVCCKRDSSEQYGDNPLEGRKIYARGWGSEKLSKRGDPFVNWEFGIPED